MKSNISFRAVAGYDDNENIYIKEFNFGVINIDAIYLSTYLNNQSYLFRGRAKAFRSIS